MLFVGFNDDGDDCDGTVVSYMRKYSQVSKPTLTAMHTRMYQRKCRATEQPRQWCKQSLQLNTDHLTFAFMKLELAAEPWM